MRSLASLIHHEPLAKKEFQQTDGGSIKRRNCN